jgi:hypothetical protein
MVTIYDMKLNTKVSTIILELYHREINIKKSYKWFDQCFFYSKCGGMAKGKCF